MSHEDTHFLESLFGKRDDLFIYIWRLKDQMSYWYRADDPALSNAVAMLDEDDLYIGCGASSNALRGWAKQRIKAADVEAIGALWADIDFGSEGHKKSNLPPTREAAEELIESFPLTPTYIIDSGHGYQCWWFFGEPWVFGEGDNERAQSLTQGWHNALLAVAQKKGWTLDSVFDLARVMRLPGSWNTKRPDELKQVRIVVDSSEVARYIIEDFQKHITALPQRTPLPTVTLPDDYAETSDIVDSDKFRALYANSDKFHIFWDRSDASRGDDSASGYDMSIANIAAAAGWSNEEIGSLLVAWRTLHHQKPKHKGYYEGTIAKSRDNEVPDAEGSEAQKVISARLGIHFQRLVEYTGEPPSYRLVCGEGEMRLSSADLINQAIFRRKLMELTGLLSKNEKGDNWHKIVNMMMATREIVSGGAESSEQGRVIEWIGTYLVDKPPRSDSEWRADVAGRNPFVKDGHLYIYSRHFYAWVAETMKEKVNQHEMAALLSRYGCVPEQIALSADRTRTTTSARRLPPDLFPVEDYVKAK